MELGLPLALRFVQRVCGQAARQVGAWRGGHGKGRGTDTGGGSVSAGGYKEKIGGHVGWWKKDQENMRKTKVQREGEGRGGAREGGGRGRK